MADYYALLAKAVANLPNPTPEARRSIYERARKALFGQLRSLEPAVPEAVIEREARALEEAVARLEVELSLDAPATRAPSPDPPAPDQVIPPAAPAPAQVIPAAAPAPGDPSEAVASSGADAPDPPDGSAETAPETVPVAVAPAPGAGSAEDTPRPTPASTGRKEARRPALPRPRREAKVQRRLWIVGAAVGIIVALVAVVAYALRDRPEDVMRPPVATQPTTSDEPAGGKIVDRIGSGEAKPIEPQPTAPAVAHEVAARPSLPQAEPPAAVARRAALLVEAPEEQAKVTVRLGTVVWRLENINNGPGELLGTAVRAEIDIPEEKLQAVMILQKNTDTTLPASHTVKLRFVIQPGSPMGNVNRINVPYMRREDAQTGDPLNGVPVPIMENSFLVGLAKGPAEATNLDLVRTREWVDVPMVFANGKIAKLTFEKGTSGQRAIEDALAAWQAQ
jgi:hypothetical protein